MLSEVYYIHTKVYSQKSSVHTHMSSGYSIRAKKKNDTSNQIPRRRCVSLAPKFPPFLVLEGCSGLAMRIASQKFNAKVHTVRLKENDFLP